MLVSSSNAGSRFILRAMQAVKSSQQKRGMGQQVRTSKVRPLLAVRRDLTQLETRFQSAQESYEELRETSEARVSRWQWVHGAAYSLDPLFFLDSDIRVGKIGPLPPKNSAGWTAYGFTNDDRLVSERQYTELPNQFYQGFYVELADRIIGYRFHYSTPRTAINCSQLVTDNSGPRYFQRWGVRGWVSYTYACTGGRIGAFVGVSKEPDEPERPFSGQVLYKADGIVELWTREQGRRGPELSFRGRPPIDNPFVRPRV
jgi:hypothetical protein